MRLVAALACMALVATACGDADDDSVTPPTTGGPARQGGVFRVPLGEPRAIDPYNTRESEGANVSKLLFVGLVTYDGNRELRMLPGVAERWSSNDQCTEWTFNLRQSKFSNGEDVTAESFIRGWTRAVEEKAASQVAYHLADVEGYAALHGPGQTATTFAGLSARDPRTFVVRLSRPDCEFDKKTLAPIASPVPSVAGAADNVQFNEAPIGNGPFMIKPGTKWEHNQGISLVRNDSYYGTQPALDGVEFVIFPAQGRLEAEYRAFQAGEADFARIPPTLFQQAKSTYEPQGNFFKSEQFGINYLLTNDARGPM
jgi:oligopeptide transport system substrate-binding protein